MTDLNIELERREFKATTLADEPSRDPSDFIQNGDGSFAGYGLEERFKGWLAAKRSVGGDVVAWQVQRIDPEEGPSLWQPADQNQYQICSEYPHLYNVRTLYTRPAINAAIAAREAK